MYFANIQIVSELSQNHKLSTTKNKKTMKRNVEDAVTRCRNIVAAIEELIKDRPEGGPITDKIDYDEINDNFIIVPL